MIIRNLFSIFDPSLRVFSSSWLSLAIIIFVIPNLFWNRRVMSSLSSKAIMIIKVEVNYSITKQFKGRYLFIFSIFCTIALYNFLALFPHIFSVTSHILISLPFSYSFWLCIIIFSWFNFLKHCISHLIPVGTPIALIRFIVIVEILRNLIRPLALTFRLTANMMAGHLLISLIGGALISLPIFFTLMGSTLQFFLVFIELGVSLIQAYVFSTLLLLYLSERQ